MGGCSSCEVTAARPTAKVIAEDGRLIELTEPMKALHVLVKSPGSFVCDADDMDFEDFVREIGAEEELRPGQIYFLLPRSMLRRRLRPEEMVALAVKASDALVRSGSVAAMRDGADGGEERPAAGRRSRKESGSGGNFTSRLGVIPELSAHDWRLLTANRKFA